MHIHPVQRPETQVDITPQSTGRSESPSSAHASICDELAQRVVPGVHRRATQEPARHDCPAAQGEGAQV